MSTLLVPDYVESTSCELKSLDGEARIRHIAKHRDLMGEAYVAGVRTSLWHALQIGLLVEQEKCHAPRGEKTGVVERLAAHPAIGLGVAQLHRYVRIVKQLPKKLGLTEEEANFIMHDKNACMSRLGSLSLADAWRLICDEKAPSITENRKKKKRLTGRPDIKDTSAKEQVDPGSLHIFCANTEIADAIASLQLRGFDFHSLEVGCDNAGDLLFLANGVRGEALPDSTEFGPWLQSFQIGLEVVGKQLKERVMKYWPAPTIESYESPAHEAN